MGNELYCYRHKEDATHRVMHCLVGTFVKELPVENDASNKVKIYPIKIMLPPNKSRVLYFASEKEQKEWAKIMSESIGYSNLFEFYDLGGNLGEG